MMGLHTDTGKEMTGDEAMMRIEKWARRVDEDGRSDRQQ